jgi:hypothetical protein
VAVGVAAAVAVGVVVATRTSDEDGTGVVAEAGEAHEARGPGAPLGDGLVVPEGAELVGPVFPLPVREPVGGAEPSDPGWAAVLAVTGHPFDAWDGLAGQAQGLGIGAPRSDTSCTWLVDGGSIGTRYVALGGAGAPAGTVALSCQASGTATAAGDDGRLLDMSLELWVDREGAHVTVGASRVPADDQVAGAGFFGGTHMVDAASPAPAGGPATEADRRTVPVVEVATGEAGPGTPFGHEVNCLERGYDQLEVPPGGRLLTVSGASVAGSRDYAAVLAVEEPEAALADLAAQMMREAPSGTPAPVARRAPLADGREVWELAHSVQAGGGHCQVVAHPDGHALLVLPRSD